MSQWRSGLVCSNHRTTCYGQRLMQSPGRSVAPVWMGLEVKSPGRHDHQRANSQPAVGALATPLVAAGPQQCHIHPALSMWRNLWDASERWVEGGLVVVGRLWGGVAAGLRAGLLRLACCRALQRPSASRRQLFNGGSLPSNSATCQATQAMYYLSAHRLTPISHTTLPSVAVHPSLLGALQGLTRTNLPHPPTRPSRFCDWQKCTSV